MHLSTVVSVRNVLGNRLVKQMRLLRDNSNSGPEVGDSNVMGDVLVIVALKEMSIDNSFVYLIDHLESPTIFPLSGSYSLCNS